jgi:hypothetical protein
MHLMLSHVLSPVAIAAGSLHILHSRISLPIPSQFVQSALQVSSLVVSILRIPARFLCHHVSTFVGASPGLTYRK